MKQKADMMDAARMLVNKGTNSLQPVVLIKPLLRTALKVRLSTGRVKKDILRHWKCFIIRKLTW